MYTNRLNWETLRSIDSATLGDTNYHTIGTPLANASYICKMVNTSTVLVTVSIDGATDIDVAPSDSFWLYDEGKVGQSGGYPALPAGTQFYVKNTSGVAGTGLIYLVTQYIVQG